MIIGSFLPLLSLLLTEAPPTLLLPFLGLVGRTLGISMMPPMQQRRRLLATTLISAPIFLLMHHRCGNVLEHTLIASSKFKGLLSYYISLAHTFPYVNVDAPAISLFQDSSTSPPPQVSSPSWVVLVSL